MKNPLRIFVLLMLLGTSLALASSTRQTATEDLRKFDAFGYLNHENYSAHLDNIAIALQSDPTASGYFIFYNGETSLPGAASRYMKRLLSYMVSTRGVDPSRMIVLEGGRREEIEVEFWIGPAGSPAPTPSPPLSIESTSARSYLFDRYSFDCDPLFQPKVAVDDIDDCAYGGSGYEDQPARLDGFLKALSQTPGATARLVVYSLPRDARRKVQKFIAKEKDYLIREGHLDTSRIAVVSRKAKHRSVELWVAPPRALGNVSH